MQTGLSFLSLYLLCFVDFFGYFSALFVSFFLPSLFVCLISLSFHFFFLSCVSLPICFSCVIYLATLSTWIIGWMTMNTQRWLGDTKENTCPRAALSITNPTRSIQGSNSELWGENPRTSWLFSRSCFRGYSFFFWGGGGGGQQMPFEGKRWKVKVVPVRAVEE